MSENSLQTSFWVMVFVQTLGSIDMPGRGDRKMPAPRQYVAILITWLVLQFIAGISAGAQKATAAIGWLLVVTGMVVGPFGTQLSNFFQLVGAEFSTNPALEAAQQTAATDAGVQPSQVSALTPTPPAGVTLGR